MTSRIRLRGAAAAGLLGLLCAAVVAWPAAAEPLKLVPNTKVQITILQWNLTKGEYQRWDALGGTFMVSQDGTLSLPILGSIEVADSGGTELAGRIATMLKDKVGLLGEPEVMVEVAEYPPVYVVGLVNKAGEYPYRPGMTVLQALALGGGRFRAVAAGGQDTLSLTGELQTLQADILRLVGRIARLEAELAGDADITFPPELIESRDRVLADEIIQLERTVFAARAKEDERQLATLSELRDLYAQELETLKARSEASDHAIELVKKQLDGVSQLYERGMTTLSRQSDLERALADLRVDRLTENTEIMRVQQYSSEARRKELGIEDQRQTGVATELKDARADLDRLRSRELTVERLLQASGGPTPSDAVNEADLVFSVVRHDNGEVVTEVVSESALLMPGDVLKVEAASLSPRSGQSASSATGQAAPLAEAGPQSPGNS